MMGIHSQPLFVHDALGASPVFLRTSLPASLFFIDAMGHDGSLFEFTQPCGIFHTAKGTAGYGLTGCRDGLIFLWTTPR